MRTKRVRLYQFSELSDKAKERALDEYRKDGPEYFWAEENRATLSAFEDVFPVKVNDYRYDDRGGDIQFTFTGEHPEMTGVRLMRYLWNNYRTNLFKGQYYHKGHTSRHSRIILDNSCTLTGYCLDMDILQPVYNFLQKPDDTTFEDLMQDCLNGWVRSCVRDIEYQNSDECITENIIANEYEFLKDGTWAPHCLKVA